ncbi:MAG: hypothetical protein M1816_005683 [Peltula sp. TS41687]|nr:MAG: hypothetical protein M1816_005683 [Peltula sp. TS41687]
MTTQPILHAFTIRITPSPTNIHESRSVLQELSRRFGEYQRTPSQPITTSGHAVAIFKTPPPTTANDAHLLRFSMPLPPSPPPHPPSTTTTTTTTTRGEAEEPEKEKERRIVMIRSSTAMTLTAPIHPSQNYFYGGFVPDTRSFVAADLGAPMTGPLAGVPRVPLEGVRDGLWGLPGRGAREAPARVRRKWREEEARGSGVGLRELWRDGLLARAEGGEGEGSGGKGRED